MASHLSSPLDVRFLPVGQNQQTWSDDTITCFLDALWPLHNPQVTLGSTNCKQYEAYCAYISKECGQSDPQCHAAQTFLDLIHLLNAIKANTGLSKAVICQIVCTIHPQFLQFEDLQIGASMDLAVRLYLMINIRGGQPTDASTHQTTLEWPPNSTLASVVEEWCKAQSMILPTIGFSHPTIPDLEKIARVKVRWTDNILDHLLFEKQTLHVFHHVSVLRRIQSSAEGDLLPPNFVTETLYSLNILLPLGRPDCNLWVAKASRDAGIDQQLVARVGGPVSLQDCGYWQAKLWELSEAFSTTSPSTASQFWHDRRNMTKWWGFWLLFVSFLLTILFGLIQSITGIMQVAISMHAQ